MIGNAIWDLIHPSEFDNFSQFLTNILETHGAKYEGLLKHSNGQWLRYGIRGKSFKDKSGKSIIFLILRKIIAQEKFDITERKKQIIKLNKVYGELDQIYNKFSPTFITDTEGVIIRVNERFLSSFNFKKSDVIGKLCSSIWKSPLCNTDKCSLIKMKEGFDSYDYEIEKKPNKGSSNHFIITTYPYLGYKGKLIGSIKVITDITGKKKMMQRLKESEEKYRRLIENSLEGVWAVDSDAVTSFINQSMANILGYTVENIIGRSLFSFMDEKEVKITKSHLKEREMGISAERDVKMIHNNGSKVYLRVRASPLFNDDGNYEGSMAFCADITKRRLAEKKLKESEEKFRKAFHSSPNLLAITKMEDDEIVNVNEGFLLTLGYTREDVIGKTTINLNIWVDPDERNRFLNVLKEKKRAKEVEVQIRTKSGQILPTLFSGEIIKLNNELHLITIATDITELKKSEKKLEELSIIKSEFLRRASHELKTPLISIKGFSDLILSLYADQLDPVILSKIREINDGCERLQNIINNLLKTSRLESPELKPKVQKEDLSFLIKFCVHELESLAERRNQSIKIDILNDLNANIEKEEIHDVLSNLITNAIKYTPPKGKIEIKTELKEDSVVVSVSDNGIGFTEEQKTKIFQQFGKIERYGQGLDLGIDGTGLGLYISKRIVELHGGKIWMESEGKNRGASFYFTLPTVK